MSIHASNPTQPKRDVKSKGNFKRPPHNLSENINNSSFTIQQYNNFINIDAIKNNIHINNSIPNNNGNFEIPVNSNSKNNEANQFLQAPKAKNLPLKTSPSPMKKEIKAKKTNYSTDRYVVDRPTTAQNMSHNIQNNTKKPSTTLFKKLQSKISRNSLEKQMGRSFENVRTTNPMPSTMNSQSSKENLNNKISQLSKKFAKKASDKNFANSFAYNNNHSQSREMQRNYAEMELSQNLKKIDTLVENFLSKNEPILQSENEVLTIYITNLLQFLMEIGEIDENFKNLFKNLRNAIEMPISKMVEQFLRLRDFLMEQNEKLHENEKEIEYLKGQITILLKENEKMSKNQIMLNNFFSDRYEINEFGLNSLQEIIKENSKLKNMLKKQKDSITETRDKDAKIMKLLYAIRKKGIDIEEIYNEDVKTPEEISFMDDNMNGNAGAMNNNQKNPPNDMYSNNKANYEDDVDESMTESNQNQHDSGIRNDLYCENSTSSVPNESERNGLFNEKNINIPMNINNNDNFGNNSNNNTFNPKSNINNNNNSGMPANLIVNPKNINLNNLINNNENNNNLMGNNNNNFKDQMKMNGQLKLNLSPLFNAQKPNPVNGKVEIKGFHEEFMARLDEFSQSWRLAAMAEKKF